MATHGAWPLLSQFAREGSQCSLESRECANRCVVNQGRRVNKSSAIFHFFWFCRKLWYKGDLKITMLYVSCDLCQDVK
jgi:hypothetical protein